MSAANAVGAVDPVEPVGPAGAVAPVGPVGPVDAVDVVDAVGPVGANDVEVIQGPDHPSSLLPASLEELFRKMLEHWYNPELPNEFSISMIVLPLLLLLQLIETVQLQYNVFVSMIAQYYLNTISTICCLDFTLSLTDLSGILDICAYFKNITTFELAGNNLVLSDMLPFLEGLFTMHDVKKFIFNRNLLYMGNFGEARETLICIFTLLFTRVKCINLSACEMEFNIVEIIIHVLENLDTTLIKTSCLVLSSNEIDTECFLQLVKVCGKLPYFKLVVEDSGSGMENMEDPEDHASVYTRLVKELGELSTLRFGATTDDMTVLPEATREILKQRIEKNVTLLVFDSPSSVVNEIVNVYTERNLNTFYLPWNTTCFSPAFLSVVISVLLLNNNSDTNENPPKLPVQMWIKIFGFFTPRMFMSLDF
jgi:hypothetical protein